MAEGLYILAVILCSQHNLVCRQAQPGLAFESLPACEAALAGAVGGIDPGNGSIKAGCMARRADGGGGAGWAITADGDFAETAGRLDAVPVERQVRTIEVTPNIRIIERIEPGARTVTVHRRTAGGADRIRKYRIPAPQSSDQAPR